MFAFAELVTRAARLPDVETYLCSVRIVSGFLVIQLDCLSIAINSCNPVMSSKSLVSIVLEGLGPFFGGGHRDSAREVFE